MMISPDCSIVRSEQLQLSFLAEAEGGKLTLKKKRRMEKITLLMLLIFLGFTMGCKFAVKLTPYSEQLIGVSLRFND